MPKNVFASAPWRPIAKENPHVMRSTRYVTIKRAIENARKAHKR